MAKARRLKLKVFVDASHGSTRISPKSANYLTCLVMVRPAVRNRWLTEAAMRLRGDVK